jgi:type IV fimbrial biogenesis protein FimT
VKIKSNKYIDICYSNSGFSLIELLIIISIIALLVAVSLPSIIDWRQNLTFRQTGRQISSLLREAKATAIASNRQQRLVLDGLLDGTYRNCRLEQGDRAVLSTGGGWVASPRYNASINFQAGTGVQAQGSVNGILASAQTMVVVNPIGSMQFTGNPVPGAADLTLNLNVMQLNPNTTKYTIGITQTGRITLSKR